MSVRPIPKKALQLEEGLRQMSVRAKQLHARMQLSFPGRWDIDYKPSGSARYDPQGRLCWAWTSTLAPRSWKGPA